MPTRSPGIPPINYYEHSRKVEHSQRVRKVIATYPSGEPRCKHNANAEYTIKDKYAMVAPPHACMLCVHDSGRRDATGDGGKERFEERDTVGNKPNVRGC